MGTLVTQALPPPRWVIAERRRTTAGCDDYDVGSRRRQTATSASEISSSVDVEGSGMGVIVKETVD